MRLHSLALVATTVAATFPILTGCTALDSVPNAYAPGVEQAPSSLPASDLFREDVARTEYAIENRGVTLAALATECAPCKERLVSMTGNATERLSLVGGLWDQWVDEQGHPLASLPQSDMPSGLAAPYDVTDLAGYMAATTENQLAWVAQGPLDVEETIAMAGILAARYGSALKLADTFGFDLQQASTQVSSHPTFAQLSDSFLGQSEGDPTSTAERPSDSQDLQDTRDGSTGTRQSDAGVVQQSFLPPEDALVAWDCLRVSFLSSPAPSLTGEQKTMVADALETRSAELLRLEVADFRPLRCSVSPSSVEDMLRSLVQQDAMLLKARDPNVRALAVQTVMADMVLWNQIAPTSVPLSTVFPAANSFDPDEVEDA